MGRKSKDWSSWEISDECFFRSLFLSFLVLSLFFWFSAYNNLSFSILTCWRNRYRRSPHWVEVLDRSFEGLCSRTTADIVVKQTNRAWIETAVLCCLGAVLQFVSPGYRIVCGLFSFPFLLLYFVSFLVVTGSVLENTRTDFYLSPSLIQSSPFFYLLFFHFCLTFIHRSLPVQNRMVLSPLILSSIFFSIFSHSFPCVAATWCFRLLFRFVFSFVAAFHFVFFCFVLSCLFACLFVCFIFLPMPSFSVMSSWGMFNPVIPFFSFEKTIASLYFVCFRNFFAFFLFLRGYNWLDFLLYICLAFLLLLFVLFFKYFDFY